MRLLKILLLSFLLPACASKPAEKPKDKKANEAKPHLVGRVASIPAGKKFVLIQSYGTWNVETGSVLTTEGPAGRAANLRVTGEKLGQYAAADIQSGTLEVGDGVYTIEKLPDLTKPDDADEDEEPKTEEKKTAPAEEPSILDDPPPTQ